jgi:hypothetical protein
MGQAVEPVLVAAMLAVACSRIVYLVLVAAILEYGRKQ